jgi:branched-chain amino acid transport system substrate-binding protein
MRQVASLHDVVVPMLLPDISINTSPTRFVPINQEQMRRFNRTSWERSATFVPLVAGTNGRKA